MKISNLKKRIMVYLKSSKGNWHSISLDTGVSVSWISKFVAGKTPRPGVDNVERLYNYSKTARGKKNA